MAPELGGTLLFVAIAVVFFTLRLRNSGNQADLFRQQALRHNGQVTTRWWTQPYLTIPKGGYEVSITSKPRSRTSIAETMATASLPSTESVDLVVAVEGALEPLRKALGGRDLELGAVDFDESFSIRSNDEQLARALLTDEVRRGLLGVKRHAPRVILTDGRLRLHVPLQFDEAAQLDDFTRAAVALFDRLHALRASR